MITMYSPCPCNSGKKFKFCCHELTKTNSLSPQAAQWPLHECFTKANWQKTGLATIFVTRKMPHGNFAIGLYLIDTFCLGVKNADLNLNRTAEEYQVYKEYIAQGLGPIIPIAYEEARSIILGSIPYAQSIGFYPHQDWQTAQHLVEPDRPYQDTFTFGCNGKPLYIEGPYDEQPTLIHKKVSQFIFNNHL